MRVMLLCLVMLGSAAAHAAATPAHIEISYAVQFGSMTIGEGRDVFEHEDGRYRVRSESKTVGLASIYRLDVKRESRGRIAADGLRPEVFEEIRNGKPKRRVDFDWSKRQATLFDGERTKVVDLPDHTWDSTSFGYNFAFAQPGPSNFPVNLTDGRRISDYRYAVLGQERLETPIGTLETLHVKKVQEPGDKRGLEVWLAREHHNLPVRIRYVGKDGRVLDSIVTRLDYSK
ncbi:MAG: DUF3108 domain-containing protein [Burkholderiales bacterium]|nr:DUF3108 domain-containing protein [Burkholderiales bacterium]